MILQDVMEDKGAPASARVSAARSMIDFALKGVEVDDLEIRVKALEKAISYDPGNTSHEINLALNFVENPPASNPMKGIQMLLQLNQKYPENVEVLLQLGKLGLQTNQFEKATERFLKVLEIDPDNNEANCILAQLYKEQGNETQSKLYLNKCN